MKLILMLFKSAAVLCLASLAGIGVVSLLSVANWRGKPNWIPVFVSGDKLLTEEEMVRLREHMRELGNSVSGLDKRIQEVHGEVERLSVGIGEISTKNETTAEAIRNEMSSLRQESEAQRKAATEMMEKMKAEAEKVRDAAEESIKSLSLYRSFINDHPTALKEFLKEIEQASRDLRSSLQEKSELVFLEVLTFGSEKDAIFARIGDKHIKQSEYTREINSIVTKSVDGPVRAYRQRVLVAESELLKSLLLESRGSSLKAMAGAFRAWPDDYRTMLIRSDLVQYLTGDGAFWIQVAEEGFTWIPIAGDLYDLSRLAYDPRKERLLKPRVQNAYDACRNSVSTRIGEVESVARTFASELKDPKDLHTRDSLYAEYVRQSQN